MAVIRRPPAVFFYCVVDQNKMDDDNGRYVEHSRLDLGVLTMVGSHLFCCSCIRWLIVAISMLAPFAC